MPSTIPSSRSDHAGRPQPLPHLAHALVVEAVTSVRSAPTARAASEPGSRRTGWSHELARRAGVGVVADGVGQVLLERAAVRDVEHLHAAADPQQRHVAGLGGVHQRELEVVAQRRHGVRFGMALRAVARRVDVAPPRP